MKNIRAYNQAMAFTSLGTTRIVSNDAGVPYFKIHGEMHHLIGQLLPARDGDVPIYSQIYFHDTDYTNELNERARHFQNLDRSMLDALQSCLHLINPYALLL